MSFSWPTVLIAVGSIVAVIGAFWTALDQASSDRELRKVANENMRLSEELRNSVTGGDSFPIAMYMPPIEPPVSDPNILGVAIRVEGKYPLFDAEFEHQDLTVPLPEDGAAALGEKDTFHICKEERSTWVLWCSAV